MVQKSSRVAGTDFVMVDDPGLVLRTCSQLRDPPTPYDLTEMEWRRSVGRVLYLSCPEGLVVIDLRAGAYGPELFVWLAVANTFGAYNRQIEALCTIARDAGAKTIAFQSHRRGWIRRLGSEWKRRGTDEFVRTV
jgi:hypothetical protein